MRKRQGSGERKLARSAATGQKIPCRLHAKLRSFRVDYSGTNRETLTEPRRRKTGPHLCFRIIIKAWRG